jgi:hypothetical protein
VEAIVDTSDKGLSLSQEGFVRLAHFLGPGRAIPIGRGWKLGLLFRPAATTKIRPKARLLQMKPSSAVLSCNTSRKFLKGKRQSLGEHLPNGMPLISIC